MRTIKFRAWHKIDRRFYRIDRFLFDPVGEVASAVLDIYGPTMLRDVVLMQFTGLKDKNGKEIWEGDVVKEPKDEQIWVVEWYQGAWWFMNPFEKTNCWTHDWLVNERGEKWRQEVIGNIYENPELLK